MQLPNRPGAGLHVLQAVVLQSQGRAPAKIGGATLFRFAVRVECESKIASTLNHSRRATGRRGRRIRQAGRRPWRKKTEPAVVIALLGTRPMPSRARGRENRRDDCPRFRFARLQVGRGCRRLEAVDFQPGRVADLRLRHAGQRSRDAACRGRAPRTCRTASLDPCPGARGPPDDHVPRGARLDGPGG